MGGEQRREQEPEIRGVKGKDLEFLIGWHTVKKIKQSEKSKPLFVMYINIYIANYCLEYIYIYILQTIV